MIDQLDSVNKVQSPRCKGNVDVVAGTFVKGWCCGPNGDMAFVQLRVNGELKAQFPASANRKDLTAAGISKFGGFQFDVTPFIPLAGSAKVEVADCFGKTLPKGSFAVSGTDLAKGFLTHALGDLSSLTVGVFGDPAYGIDLAKGSALSKILNVLGVTTKRSVEGDIINIWFTHPTAPKPAGISLLNGGFKDAAKSAIDVAHRQVLGRGLCVRMDEIASNERYVIKSEVQAAHDGKIKIGSEVKDEDFSGKVVQRLVDNRIDSQTVQDIRVPYIGGEIPFAYLKSRSINDRFSNGNKTAHITAAHNVLSAAELSSIKAFCAALQVDYGELDVLRNAGSGEIWIVDVNNTPSGPPNGLTKGESDFAVREMAMSFARRFLGFAPH